jgi:hypothetical protein
MVGGLDADDLPSNLLVALLDEPDELELGLGGADDEDFFRVGEVCSDLVEERVILGDAPMELGVAARLVRPVEVMGHVELGALDVVRVDVKDLGFLVVQPDDRVSD